MNEQYAYIDGPVNLVCKVDAQPQAEFAWYRKGQRISAESEKYEIITDANESVLHFNMSTMADLGEYTCEAKNKIDMIKRTITLLNGTKPDRPPKLELRGMNSNIFDIDIGVVSTEKPHSMSVTHYCFEIVPVNEYKASGWEKSRKVKKSSGKR